MVLYGVVLAGIGYSSAVVDSFRLVGSVGCKSDNQENCDVPQSNILGYKMADIPRATARRLKLKDPRVVKCYLEILTKYFDKKGF